MRIGIIGKGKMGKEIINIFLPQDIELTWVCRKESDIELLTTYLSKQLKKLHKRGYIDSESLAKKNNSTVVSVDLNCLRESDIVIETITEDLEEKVNIFKKLELIVREETILATNTSSIPLNQIFDQCRFKNRCLGLHFFYPTKIIGTVEINKTSYTDDQYVKVVEDILLRVDRVPLILEESVNMLLSKMILNLMCEAYLIYEEGYLSCQEIDELIKQNFMMFGIFEILDSTGINIVVQCARNFYDERHKSFYSSFRSKMEELSRLSHKYDTFGKYESENIRILNRMDEVELNQYKVEIIKRLQCVLINELTFMIQNGHADKQKVLFAVKTVLGLSDEIDIDVPVQTERINFKEKWYITI